MAREERRKREALVKTPTRPHRGLFASSNWGGFYMAVTPRRGNSRIARLAGVVVTGTLTQTALRRKGRGGGPWTDTYGLLKKPQRSQGQPPPCEQRRQHGCPHSKARLSLDCPQSKVGISLDCASHTRAFSVCADPSSVARQPRRSPLRALRPNDISPGKNFHGLENPRRYKKRDRKDQVSNNALFQHPLTNRPAVPGRKTARANTILSYTILGDS